MERTRVLIADDNGTYGAVLSRFISSQHDMEVVGLASDGGEAVHLASLLQPDVVLMDLRMPVLDGFETTRVLVATHRDVKVIGLTAQWGSDAARRCIEAGAIAFLHKADVDSELLGLIRTLVEAAPRNDPADAC